MAKPAIVFVCAECGAETLKWQGQCPQCSHWNTLEQRVGRAPAGRAGGAGATARGRCAELSTGRAAAPADRHGRARPGPRRRTDSGLGHVARRRARHRQIHAAAAAREPRGPRHAHAVPVGRGVRGADRRARAAARGRRGSHLRVVADTDLEATMARAREERRQAADRRLHPDRAAGLGGHGRRRHHPAQGMHGAAGAIRQELAASASSSSGT